MPPTLYAGAARVKLDPPVGLAMAGYGRRVGRSAGIRDDLAAQAIVFSDGTHRAAIATVDVLALGIRICDAIAAEVAAATGIPAEAVMICATHTHSGPQFNIFATPKNDSNIANASPVRDLKWERALPDKIAQAIIEADSRLRPAKIRAGAGRFGLGTNRRLMRTDGSIQLAPNYAGVADTELKALAVCEAKRDADPIAFLLNYPCHGVVLCEDNLLYSRDWPGFAADAIESRMNKHRPDNPSIALFAQGATGNIDPARRGTFEIAADAGLGAARVAIDALSREVTVAGTPLITRRVPLRMKLRDLSAKLAIAMANVQQTEAALNNHAGVGGYQLKRLTDQHQRSLDELAALRALDDANRRDKRVDHAGGELLTHTTIIALGDIAFVGIPGELFAELGLTLKSNPYFRHTFVLGYCNDLVGYIPTREAYEFGGYEVETSRVGQGAGELLTNEALANMSQIRQELNQPGVDNVQPTRRK
ncbi:MAG: neutral/alkaline non-lysosomal ceramidase N-terminal domain-containing protein [Candidatus Binataceae bacterium]